jgi:DNA-cytosine methyltransferase
VIDLFCGAGGLSEGLRQAGINPVAGVDFDKHAVATYRHNHPGVPVVEGDVADVTGEHLMELAGTREIDLIAGGPSCQGFSTHGKRMQDDPRNFLFKHFVRLVDEIQPKMFLMENVRGMLTYGKANSVGRSKLLSTRSDIAPISPRSSPLITASPSCGIGSFSLALASKKSSSHFLNGHMVPTTS